MPTYEYECLKCGANFERFQKITDKPVARCPECKGKVRRLPSTGAGVIFKGSGFYQTDYRSESYKKKAKEESGSQPKSESKPAADETGAKGKKT